MKTHLSSAPESLMRQSEFFIQEDEKMTRFYGISAAGFFNTTSISSTPALLSLPDDEASSKDSHFSSTEAA
jgi:hypothetical protein